MRINKISPNPEKTEYMIIGHSRKVNAFNISSALKLNGTDIKRVTKTKSIGVIIDENLKWDEQYKVVKRKDCEKIQRRKPLGQVSAKDPRNQTMQQGTVGVCIFLE